MNRGRGRSPSQLPNQNDDEILSIEKQYEFINMSFKYGINDLENIIQMFHARLLAEESYLNSLQKVKKLASFNDADRHHEAPQSSFQTAVKFYEATINDIIESRQRLKDTIKLEIDVLIKQKEIEEQNRKTNKSKLYDANNNYITFRRRDIAKLQKAYVHKCEDLKVTQNNWQEQQQLDLMNNAANRNSLELTANNFRLSGDYNNRDGLLSDSNSISDQSPTNKKGMAGLISQMRTRTPLDQSKQMTKVTRMKKDITDADNEYRDGILMLEHLRKKQTKTMDEVNKQLQNTIQRKTETVKTTLINILHSELDTLQMEMNISRNSLEAATSIDSLKDAQLFSLHYQSLGYIKPAPVRYENYYMEGKCKEVLFGGSLEAYAVEHSRAVPLLVTKCIDAIEAMGGLQKEGIYRISGRQANIDQLKHQFELDEEKVNLDNFDVFTIATVLKMYIRELKRPLFDFNVQTRSAYNKNMPQAQKFNLLETKLSNLSLAHRSTLHCIIRHLSKVNAHNQANKMNISNLAMIFTPVIFHDYNQTDESLHLNNEWSPDDLFGDLLLYHDLIFPKAEDFARRINEPKLNQALNGQSPFSQYSRSNLLYLMPAQQTNSMLLTQPMSSPLNYPPKLTTLIGTVPNTFSPSARNRVGNSDATDTHHLVVVQQQSDTELLENKIKQKENNENRHLLPPRQDSLLRKQVEVKLVSESSKQYQANLDYSLLDQHSDEL
ncbi:uncharacterized protein BX663DRAFT_505448 [Cokeromyces recurvatus]|uniref:uncharacterized protein n=1 Tax=Cokeromyces recurvatus TaxID=90255 RepID=UPI00221E7739|nr:uncharacterized protein BX663DRAFT_505448 [Cokeromyces recurvatus]KAI7903848.1 hypothetical protein BX663DRAFT_505448 [Cokeromyces recurvatus]